MNQDGGMIHGLDLFSGYGGAAESLEGFVKPIAYCEVESGAQRILLHRMRKGQIAPAPIWDDVRTLHREHIESPIDIITGGWPCKGHSPAGPRSGLDHEESRLFYEIARLAREFGPKFLFLENSPGLLDSGNGFDEVLGELAAQGFYVEWGVLSAFDVGAPHLRERLSILAAHPDRIGIREQSEFESRCGLEAITPATRQERQTSNSKGERCREGRTGLKIWKRSATTASDCVSASKAFSFAHAASERLEGRLESWKAWQTFCLGGGGECWPSGVPEPTVRRLDDGAARRRAGTIRRISISAGGNGWVIPCAREAFKRLFGIADSNRNSSTKVRQTDFQPKRSLK